ncbi:MAG: TIGR01777 family oxidoreductase [Dehalococcoidia bacterium]
MRVAVTGSSGLIGTALLARLRAGGHEGLPVRRGARTEDGVAWLPDEGWIEAGALEGVDAVVHLAGESIGDGRWTKRRKRAIRDSRIDSTRLLVEHMATLTRPPRVFVCGSAIGYYGDRGGEELREDASTGEGFLAEVVRDWEREASGAARPGTRVVSLRTAVVLAPRGGALQRMRTPFRLGVGGRLGSGRQWMSWITLEDEVRAIEWVLTHDDVSGPVNLSAPHPVTNREFTKALGRELHRPTRFPVPGFALRIILGEMAEELLLHGQRVLPEKLLRSGFGFEHETVEEGLQAVLATPAGSGEVAASSA